MGQLTRAYWCYLSRPAHQRPVIRRIVSNRCQRILEIGLGDGKRALRMLQLATEVQPDVQLTYVGIDPFESQPSHLAMRDAYKVLRASGAMVRLFPGDPAAAINALAHVVKGTDLVVISEEYSEADLVGIWEPLARMISPASLAFRALELKGKLQMQRLTHEHIQALASQHATAPRRAA